MKNAELARKIKELRARKGFSQDELAETSGLNLRTIQRIESGETEPRGDTLQRLSNALGVTPDELIDWGEQQDKGFLVALNLSALSFIAFPLLGIIVPMALWVLRKNKIKGLGETGKRLLNFQISWCISVMVIYGLFITLMLFNIPIPIVGDGIRVLNMGSKELLILLVPVLYFFNVIFIVINAIRSYQEKKVFYKPAIRFLK